uniref:Uncharacterized protein n=1 Tax=Hyaloperonospora arabidopsidis (strain Emoy2) TaxID=559515 RepID=M4BSR4_HYAAE
MLKDTPERLQRVAIQQFVNHKLDELRRQASTPAAITGSNVIKLDVPSYRDEGPDRLALNRWLCEVDIAVQPLQLTTEFDDLCLAFEPPQGEHHHRSTFLALKQGGHLRRPWRKCLSLRSAETSVS